MKKWFLTFFLLALLFTFLFQWYNFLFNETGEEKIRSSKEVSLNEFAKLYQKNTFVTWGIKIINERKLIWLEEVGTGYQISMTLKKKIPVRYYNEYISYKPITMSLADIGINVLTGDNQTPIKAENNEQTMTIWGFFIEHILPFFIFLLLLVWFMKLFGPKGGSWWFPFSVKIGKLATKKDVTTKFSDIAGMEEVKQELVEIIDFLKNPQKYQEVWARPPKGVLLYGVPWSGKTLLAKAVAGEANAAFFSASGSEFMEMLVGMGAAKVRELFAKAKANTPAIIFIDEIDAIGKRRGIWYTWWHQEQEQTLNQILTEMDWFESWTGVIVIAATNRPDTLDPALLRSGRFDRKIMVGTPTLEERVLIFNYYLKNKKLADDVSVRSLAKRTSGFVGADIENMVNEAALKIAREGRKVLTNEDFEYALEKIVMWPEKKIKSMNEQERKMIAYHELGHAICAYNLPECDPVEKISIVSRWQALGVTWIVPEEDKYLHTKAKFLDELVKLYGGRAAEELFFGLDKITTGWANDFLKATEIARDMVLKYGMDEELGQILYLDVENDDYQGRFRRYSEQTAQKADEKIKKITADQYQRAKDILSKESKIHIMAEILLEKEYLTREEFEDLMSWRVLPQQMLQDAKRLNEKRKNEQQNNQKKEEMEV